LTQWDEIYFRLSSSDYKDPRWQAENFGLQRSQDVIKALKWIEKQDINKYNFNSVATAKLGTVVVGALAGKKAKTSPEDFLPFDTRMLKKDTGVTDASLGVLMQLLKTRKLDGRIIGMLSDEIKNASSREIKE
jgi:hypothetical protein